MWCSHEVEARPTVTCRSDGKWSVPSMRCHGGEHTVLAMRLTQPQNTGAALCFSSARNTLPPEVTQQHLAQPGMLTESQPQCSVIHIHLDSVMLCLLHAVCTGLPTAALPNGAWPEACRNIRHESWCQGKCNAGWYGSPKGKRGRASTAPSSHKGASWMPC